MRHPSRPPRAPGSAAAALLAVALLSGSAAAVPYHEPTGGPIAGFDDFFGSRTVLLPDVDEVYGEVHYWGWIWDPQTGYGLPYWDVDYFELTGLTPDTSFTITLDAVSGTFGFELLDTSGNLLTDGEVFAEGPPATWSGLVPASGSLVVSTRASDAGSYHVVLQSVPEPTPALLLGLGLCALAARARRR